MAVRFDEVELPRALVQFPVEVRKPKGFRFEEPATWPKLEGRLEYVDGRLWFMPPCGDVQQDVAMDVAYALRQWVERNQAFVVGGNEAGMLLGSEVRGADAAVWRQADLGAHTGGYRRVPPVVAVEIAGQDEQEADLRSKLTWYLDHGVTLVWLVLPASREVVVVRRTGETRHGLRDRIPAASELPGLNVEVASLFAQLDRSPAGR